MIAELEYIVLEEVIFEVGIPGPKGDTPYVGSNGNWYISEIDTGIKAIAIDGLSPYIQSGYWYLGDVNMGVKAQGVDGFATPMTETQRLAIVSPAVGQVINQTDGGRGEWTWLGSYWIYKENRPYSTKTVTASRDLSISDLGYMLIIDSPTDITLTVPLSIFDIGHKLFFMQKGLGKLTLAATSPIVLQPPPFYSLKTSGPGALMEVIFTNTTFAFVQGHTL